MLRKREEALRARGVPLRHGELLGFRRNESMRNLLWLYNRAREEQGLPPVRMGEFDPWGEHADAQRFVAEAFGLNSPEARATSDDRLLAARLFPRAASAYRREAGDSTAGSAGETTEVS